MVESTSLTRDVLAAGAHGVVLKGELDQFVIDAIETCAQSRQADR